MVIKVNLAIVGFLVTLAIAVALFGLVTGWLVGRSGPDASVIATVLPALLAAIIPISGIFFFSRLFPDTVKELLATLSPSHGIAISASVAIFVLSLYGGVNFGEKERRKVVGELADRKVSTDRTFRRDELVRCSSLQKFVNDERRKVNLPLLTSDYFCGHLKLQFP